jgi:hypothetical protein
MKSITSNWRPLLRAFYPFLIASAVLWAAPRNACAQLYLTNRPHFFLIGRVSEYNATTGEVVNANFITGLNLPTGIAVKGNTLFVAAFEELTRQGVVLGLVPLPPDSDGTIHFKN